MLHAFNERRNEASLLQEVPLHGVDHCSVKTENNLLPIYLLFGARATVGCGPSITLLPHTIQQCCVVCGSDNIEGLEHRPPCQKRSCWKLLRFHVRIRSQLAGCRSRAVEAEIQKGTWSGMFVSSIAVVAYRVRDISV